MMADVEEMFIRLLRLPGVLGAILVNGQGIPIKSSLEPGISAHYAGKMSQLIKVARSMVRDVEPSDDLNYIRVRTRKHELMVAHENDHMIILLQDSVALDEVRRSSAAAARLSAVK